MASLPVTFGDLDLYCLKPIYLTYLGKYSMYYFYMFMCELQSAHDL